MTFYRQNTRSAAYLFVIGLAGILFFIFSHSISLLALSFFCLGTFLFSEPFDNAIYRKLGAGLIILFSVIMLVISFIRLTRPIGYEDYTPNILSFPFVGVFILGSFYSYLTAKDDKLKKSKDSVETLIAKEVLEAFLLSAISGAALIATYSLSYYFEPSCAMLIAICTVAENLKSFAKQQSEE